MNCVFLLNVSFSRIFVFIDFTEIAQRKRKSKTDTLRGSEPYKCTLQSGINVGPTFINFGIFSKPYSLIKGPTFIKFWNFYQGLQKFSSLMGFLLHKFAHFADALRLFKALRLFFLSNFPGPTFIPCPTSIPETRVNKSRYVLALFQSNNRSRDRLSRKHAVK